VNEGFTFFSLNKLLFIKKIIYCVCYISFIALSKLENEPFTCDRRIEMMMVMALNVVILLKSIYYVSSIAYEVIDHFEVTSNSHYSNKHLCQSMDVFAYTLHLATLIICTI
jgi:hypothetical protein